MEIASNVFFITTSLLITFILTLIIYMKWCLTYWQRRKIPALKAKLPFGNLENPFTSTKTQGQQYQMFYEELKRSGARFGGIFAIATPIFMPIDPECIRWILAKDFQQFESTGFYSNEKDQPVSAILYAMNGNRWRNLRAKLTPAFTPGKTKSMFECILQCTGPMKIQLEEDAAQKTPVAIGKITAFYTTDVTGNCIFGLDCNSFTDPDAKIFRLIRHLMDKTVNLSKLTFCFCFPNLAKQLGVTLFPRDGADFFSNVILETVAYREKNNVSRKDLLQLLIDLKNGEAVNGNEGGGKLTINEIISQSFLFFLAGFDTTSLTMQYCLFELARHKIIQQKVREEIKSVLAEYNQQLSYEALGEMKYLQQIFEETLRKYPPLAVIPRLCTEDYSLPCTGQIIEKGTNVAVSILGLHYDPEYYPDPDKFDPERFSEENKQNRKPYTYLPFGEGPRQCLGFRFGTMTAKTGLAVLIRHFEFSVNPTTKLPFQFKLNLLSEPADDIILDVQIVTE